MHSEITEVISLFNKVFVARKTVKSNNRGETHGNSADTSDQKNTGAEKLT